MPPWWQYFCVGENWELDATSEELGPDTHDSRRIEAKAKRPNWSETTGSESNRLTSSTFGQR
jgi:hypothetical protein